MKKTMRFLSIAALVLMGAIMAGCTSNELVNELSENTDKKVNDKTVTLTTTVSLSGATKALTATGEKTFAEGDQIAVIYKNTSNETVKAVSAAISSGVGTSSATFSVTLTNPDNTKAIRYIYPAAMAKETVETDATIDDLGTVDFTKLNTQDGSLTTLGSNLDLCTFDAADWTSGELPTGSMTNQFAILAITLKDNTATPAEITGSITGMTISDCTNTYAVSREAAAGPIYVAIRPTTSAIINIIATDGTKNYIKTLTSKTYAASNGYNVSWRMGQPISLAGLTDDYVAQDGDFLTGVLDVENHPVKISIADGATVTLAGITINGVTDDADDSSESAVPWAGIRCEGDATIILADGTTNIVKGFYEDFPGIWIRENYTLTINGTGSLVASSNGHGAGIGGGRITTFGNIRIEGGNITAIGGNGCAGIGAGWWGSGNITITGGYINATGHKGGSGIGSGTNDATCGNITISGGTIIASSDEGGAGIGAGWGVTCGDITIDDGTITATGGDSGAGIGAGTEGTCGKITIKGGSITATGGVDGAGIGIGYEAECGNISISGGTIEATGTRYGAGIGCSGYGKCGTIEITSDVTQVKATKGNTSSHSIGFGLTEGDESYITCGAVTIGGTVYWNGSNYQNDGDSYLSASPFIYPAL